MSSSGASIGLELTDEQQQIVDSKAPALVVTAPAGTGKTEVLVRRAERFVSDPSNGHAHVLVVTYTTRAADEFLTRLRHQIGSAMHRVTAETVHGYSQRLLSVHAGHVGLPLDFQVIVKDEDRAELLADNDASWHFDEEPNRLFQGLDLARAKGIDHPQLSRWHSALIGRGAVDFNEMIFKATEVVRIPAIAEMQRNIYGLVLVDEAQNLTPQQYGFLMELIGQCSDTQAPLVQTTLLGDPNQLVTGFAGGDSSLMERFAAEYGAQRLTLTRNFRSSRRLARLEQIVSSELRTSEPQPAESRIGAARGVMKSREFDTEQSEGKFIAKWATRLLTDGLPAAAMMDSESSVVRSEDIAVLARHAASLGSVSEALASQGHAVARAHSEDALMATDMGQVAMMLMRSRSDRHRGAAAAALSRDFGIDLPAQDDASRATDNAAAAESLRSATNGHFGILTPLLSIDSPAAFVEKLDGCGLSADERCELLADWAADRGLIHQTWTDFANITPTADRTWTRFALHIDRMARGRDIGSGIRLLTVHKAQAREFKAVAIVGMNDGQFPDFRATSPEAERAELQTFYVAATRASRALVLTRARERPTRYGPRATGPSRYLNLVEQARNCQ